VFQVTYKVPNGKLLKISFEKKDDIIQNIKITGDFFLYPEEKITVLEDALTGEKLDKLTIQQELEEVILTEKIELFGIDSESIVKAIFLAK